MVRTTNADRKRPIEPWREAVNAVEIEVASFQPVEGGYLYEAPSALIFAPGARYIVSEAQKTELLAILTPRRPMLRIILIVAAVLALVLAETVVLRTVLGHDQPTVFDFFKLAMMTAVPAYIAGLVIMHRHLRRLQRILGTAVPTQKRRTILERLQAVGAGMSTKKLVLLSTFWSVMGIADAVRLLIPSHSGQLAIDNMFFVFALNLVTAAAFAAYFFAMALTKLRNEGSVH
jgi:hypothetical protein